MSALRLPLLLAAVALALLASANPAAAQATCSVEYTIEEGDTLYLLGERYGVDWVDIFNANAVDWIVPGLNITIPSCSDPVPTPQLELLPEQDVTCEGYYTIVAGDTLSAIGEALGVAWEAIFEANRHQLANPNSIDVDMVLNIPPCDPVDASAGMSG